VPYHSTAANYQDLCDDIGSVAAIVRFDAVGGGFATFFCGGLGDVPLIKANSVAVILDVASAACTGPGTVNWVPSHF
jgi:hypothetical protein